MVIELLVKPEDAERKPYLMIGLGIIFATFAVLSVSALNLANPGVLIVAMASIIAIPFVYGLFSYEESTYENDKFLGSNTLARHFPIIVVLAGLFFGLIIGFTAWNLILPPEQAKAMFGAQLSELSAINSNFAGQFTAFTGHAVNLGSTQTEVFENLFVHNFQVLVLIILFSLIYGAGAVLILAWNASVIAVFLAGIARQFVLRTPGEYALWTGLGNGFLGILPHGTFELLSYCIGAIAGGVLSRAIVTKQFEKKTFPLILHDIAKLIAWAIILLAIGAVIETTAIMP
ncbi:stage II sporulation protein M [Candidatus Micrarchaeota archaeon]|nr:stage II sporulation protein M [Candidatus Micrarchaeota archaeon]